MRETTDLKESTVAELVNKLSIAARLAADYHREGNEQIKSGEACLKKSQEYQAFAKNLYEILRALGAIDENPALEELPL